MAFQFRYKDTLCTPPLCFAMQNIGEESESRRVYRRCEVTKKAIRKIRIAFLLLCSEKLLSDTQLFLCNDGTVAVDVDFDEVVEQTTTFTNQHFKSSFSAMIFMI